MPAIWLLLLLHQVLASEFLDEFQGCRDEGLGNTTHVCDPEGRLADSTRDKLEQMLSSLKSKIGCSCPSGCRRANGNEDFIGLLQVTSSKSTKDLEGDSKKIFKDAELGNVTCDHGLLLVYLKDTQQLATYRGADSFVKLTDEDMQKLHRLAAKGPDGNDAVALQFLLSNYKDVAETSVLRADSWVTLIGLIVAIMIVLCIVGFFLVCLMARYCCCCVKNKKDVYHVNTLPSYKTIEPLYVITPPGPNRAMSDVIYSTPYSGSPLPFPPPPGSAVPLTPSSGSRHRIHPETPGSIKRNGTKSTRSEGSLKRLANSEYAMPPSEVPPQLTEVYGTIPRATLSSPPRGKSSPQSPKDPNEIDWLDPQRKQETQTREELIY